jgi:hypothetical protein
MHVPLDVPVVERPGFPFVDYDGPSASGKTI